MQSRLGSCENFRMIGIIEILVLNLLALRAKAPKSHLFSMQRNILQKSRANYVVFRLLRRFKKGNQKRKMSCDPVPLYLNPSRDEES